MLMRPLAVVALAFVGLACGGSSNTTLEDGGSKEDASSKKDASHDSGSKKDASHESGTEEDASEEGASDASEESDSETDASEDTTEADSSTPAACQDRATAECALMNKCRPTGIQTNYGTEAACVKGLEQNCENSLAAPSNGNNATVTEACAKAFPSWSCADFENDVNIPTACQQQMGSLASGSACAFPGQCTSGFCAIPPNTECGVCAALPAAGDSCAKLTTCGPGLNCVAKTQTCVKLAAKGDACGAGAPCGYELSCVGANATKGTQGTCQAAVETVGATCDPTLNKGAGCDLGAGLTCNTTTLKCAKVSVAATGKPCGTVDDQDALCSAGGTCTAATGMAGTCIAPAAEGKTCADVGGTGCVAPQRCIGLEGGASGTCEFNSAATCM
jgi:hypothetical protein